MRKHFLFRTTALIIALLMVVTSACVLCYAATDKPTAGRYRTDYLMNMRNAPSTEGTLLLQIPKGTELTVTAVTADTSGEHSDWYWGAVTYNGTKGYVCLYYCSAVTDTPVIENPTGTPMSAGLYKTLISVNMRSGPGSSYSWTASIPAGKVINVTAVSADSQGYYWGKTTYNAYTGTFTAYVRLDNCEKYTLPALTDDDLRGEDKVNWKIIADCKMKLQ